MSSDETNPPARRLRVALDLFEFGEAMLRRRLRRVRPAASEAEIEVAVAAWRTERAGAEPCSAKQRRPISKPPGRRFA